MIGVVKKNLHFRKTAEKTDNIIKILPKDQNVNVVEDLGEWLKVKEGKTTGYVMAEYVAFAPEAAKDPGDGEEKKEIPEQIEMSKDEAKGEIDEEGNFIIDGKIVGKVDGDNILITDPDIIAETLAEMKKEDGKDE